MSRSSTKKLPYVLEDGDAEALLDSFNTRYWTPHRNRLMCEYMLRCGLRVGEVTALTLGHIYWSHKLEVVDGKGGRDRVVYLPEDLLDRTLDFVERCEELERLVSNGYGRYDDSLTFPNRNNEEVDHRYMRRMVKRQAKRAGVRRWQEVSPHTLRHTFATRTYRRTGNIRAVQKMLGHADLSTTMRYTHIHDEELKTIMMAG